MKNQIRKFDFLKNQEFLKNLVLLSYTLSSLVNLVLLSYTLSALVNLVLLFSCFPRKTQRASEESSRREETVVFMETLRALNEKLAVARQDSEGNSGGDTGGKSAGKRGGQQKTIRRLTQQVVVLTAALKVRHLRHAYFKQSNMLMFLGCSLSARQRAAADSNATAAAPSAEHGKAGVASVASGGRSGEGWSG